MVGVADNSEFDEQIERVSHLLDLPPARAPNHATPQEYGDQTVLGAINRPRPLRMHLEFRPVGFGWREARRASSRWLYRPPRDRPENPRATGRNRESKRRSGFGAAQGDSPTIAARLQRAESELARVEVAASAPTIKVTRMLPRIAESYRALVANLGDVATRDVARTRTEIRRLRPSESGTFLEAHVPNATDKLIELAVRNGANSMSYQKGVAGARFGTYSTTGIDLI